MFETQVSCLRAGLELVVGKSFSMKANRILSFALFTFNIVWGKPGGGGVLAFWLIEPLIIDLARTDYTS
jgi:hypothetical protein